MIEKQEEREHKTAGQIAYEAAGDWVAEHQADKGTFPTWATLDVSAREYWDRIGSAVRAPLVTAIGSFVDGQRSRSSAGDAYHNMLVVAGLPRSIRGLW